MSDEKESTHNVPIGLPVLLGAVAVLWLLSWVLPYFLIEKWETRSQFGDMFGAANALFAGLAFAILVYTMWLQRKELELQRQELELTRGELARAATAQEESRKAFEQQVSLMARSNYAAVVAAMMDERLSQSVSGHHRNIFVAELKVIADELQKQIEASRGASSKG